jgi:Ca2+-binding RTX toxin-like protein
VIFPVSAGITYYFQVSSAGATPGGTLVFHLTGATGGGAASDTYPPTTPITLLPFTATVDTTGATLQAGEPVPPCVTAHGHSVWFAYTPTTGATLTADTMGSNYDTVLTVYQTTWASPLACNDNISTTDLDSRVTFTAIAGATYYFQVSSQGTGPGGTLTFHLSGPTGTPWDDYYQPLAISVLPYTHTGNTSTATIQAGEPVPSCVSSHDNSVWYTYRPSTAMVLTADTRGSNYDTVLQVYEGSWATRVPSGCDDDISTTDPDSEVTFSAKANTTYYFQVSSVGNPSNGGTLVFHLAAEPEPPWDEYTDPYEITSLPFEDDNVDTTMATLQTGEPKPSCVSGHNNSVWYEYTPDVDEEITADTEGSNYDTVLAVYENTWSNPVACDDDDGSGDTSMVEFTAEAGETYLFQISSNGSSSDGGTLDFRVDGEPVVRYCRGVEATIVGTDDPDTIFGTEGDDVIVGLDGNDRIFAYGGNDLICAGFGYDRVFAGEGDDLVFGQAGNDIMAGGAGADRIFGWGGDDIILGKAGADRLLGGAGDDGIYSGPDDDEARGGTGDDIVYGGPHDDILFGNAGYDVLRGGSGDDWCHSGEDVIC